MRRRDALKVLAGTTAFNIVSRNPAVAQAQAWPDRPVKCFVSFAAGGATDLVARPWADILTKAFGQQFVVENRGGASGLIGNEAAFKSPPDGHTFLFSGNTATVGLLLLRKHSFDPRQFVAVAHMGNAISGFVVHPSVGVKKFQELLGYAKKNPGKLIMLTVNAPQRFEEVPDVPTPTEAGIKDADMGSWFGLYGPPGMPREIAARLNAKINEISPTPEWKAKMRLVACTPSQRTWNSSSRSGMTIGEARRKSSRRQTSSWNDQHARSSFACRALRRPIGSSVWLSTMGGEASA